MEGFMLCKIGDKSDLEKRDYFFEPKLDGTRAFVRIKGGELAEIRNRRGNSIIHRYPEFGHFPEMVDAKSCLLDGEIIVYDNEGKPDFNLLQRRDLVDNRMMIEIRSKEIPATYVVFDILTKDGENLRQLPLKQRKKILNSTVREDENLQIIFHTKDGKKLWKEVKDKQLEGVVAKKSDSRYLPVRSSSWLKIKFLKTIDCVIIGYTSEKRAVSALALGVYYENKKIRYIGRVGTGFTQRFIRQLLPKLKKIGTKRRPKNLVGEPSKDVQWVKPELVCEIEFLETTKHRLRAPVFKRLRTDKSPEECTYGQIAALKQELVLDEDRKNR